LPARARSLKLSSSFASSSPASASASNSSISKLPQTKSLLAGLSLSVAPANPPFSRGSTFAPLIQRSPSHRRGPAPFTLSPEGLDPISAGRHTLSSRPLTHVPIPTRAIRCHPARCDTMSSPQAARVVIPTVARDLLFPIARRIPKSLLPSKGQSPPAEGNRYSSHFAYARHIPSRSIGDIVPALFPGPPRRDSASAVPCRGHTACEEPCKRVADKMSGRGTKRGAVVLPSFVYRGQRKKHETGNCSASLLRRSSAREKANASCGQQDRE